MTTQRVLLLREGRKLPAGRLWVLVQLAQCERDRTRDLVLTAFPPGDGLGIHVESVGKLNGRESRHLPHELELRAGSNATLDERCCDRSLLASYLGRIEQHLSAGTASHSAREDLHASEIY